MIVPDVIQVLLQEHDEMRRLSTDVRQAGGPDKRGLFAELYQLVNVHELGDLAVVHPAARGKTANGDRTVLACMTDGGDIARALAELHTLGVEHVTFDSTSADGQQQRADASITSHRAVRAAAAGEPWAPQVRMSTVAAQVAASCALLSFFSVGERRGYATIWREGTQRGRQH